MQHTVEVVIKVSVSKEVIDEDEVCRINTVAKKCDNVAVLQ